MGDDKIPVPNRRPTIRRTAENKAFEYGVIFGAFGLTIGVIVGESISVDKVVKIEEKSDSEIQEILEKLRKKARKKNAQ
jgi:hypothetical protein